LLGYWRTEDDPAMVPRLRFLHDDHDFSSACVRNFQDGPRVLSTVGLLTGMGDAHHFLDVPPSGVFDAEDFRVCYELVGKNVGDKAVGGGLFELSAGSHRTVIHPVPGPSARTS